MMTHTPGMISTVPWPELLHSIQRIVHSGSEGFWVPSGPQSDLGIVPVRCYATSNFVFATVVARRSDLPKFLACTGRLQISSPGDEIVLLNFLPTAATLLADALGGAMAQPMAVDRQLGTNAPGTSDAVLIFGRVLAVELLVPSHAIDVMASNSRNVSSNWPNPVGIGLN